ncbi:MAG: putative molybdopterin oxidoreductase [Pseudobdellovibrio sp.]|jgi:hypothetical protein|nr:putative molybdopterin oxidoreductase [Pseudobdellovibrio sp.]
MGTHSSHQELKLNKFELSSTLKGILGAALLIGLATFIFGFVKNPDRMWPAYLTAFFYFASIASTGMFFVAFNHAANAGWSASIRRFAEAMSAFFPYMLGGGLLLFVGIKYLYAWGVPETYHTLTGGKQTYLAPGFVLARMIIFGLGSIFFAKKIVGNSLKQDTTGDHQLTKNNLSLSVGYIAFFAIFFSLFSIDLLMSLLPTWYSTIYGVYCFAAGLQATFAFLSIVIVVMKNSKWISGYVTEEHQHDVGKYLKGFSVFWAYIAFSQFMLIWYANIPEETEFYIMRSLNGWMPVSFALLIFRFIVPFLVLLPRGSKRTDSILVGISALVLVMHYVDIYWLVYPNFFDGIPQFGLWEVGMFLFFAAIFLGSMFQFMSKNNLVAIKDPRLHEALKHHVTY